MTHLTSTIPFNELLGFFGYVEPKFGSSKPTVEAMVTSMQDLSQPTSYNIAMMLRESRKDKASYRRNPSQYPVLDSQFKLLIDKD